jgi:O-antigen/teichoic acid export membrane protein
MAGSFLRNTLWNVAGFSVSLFSGILLSPYVFRRLGAEGYGLWALAFSLVDYLWLSDMGFRSAVLKYSAHYQASRDTGKINMVLNTALAWFLPMGGALLVLIWQVTPWTVRYFRVPDALAEPFSALLLAVGFSWAFGLVNNVFRAALEGFQQYGVINRINILATGVRATAVFVLLASGYGLREMGYAVVAAQSLGYVLTFLGFRRVFPELRFSLSLVDGGMLKQMAGYGVHTMLATVATQLSQQGPPVLIGRMLSASALGFFSWPSRLLNTFMDLVPQVGMVSGARSAELSAKNDYAAVARLGAQTNRYCFAVFLLPLLLLGFYAAPLFRLWIGEDVARWSAPVAVVLSAAYGFAIAGQQNSSAILYGIGSHKRYAQGLLVEACAGLLAMYWILPRHGIFGAAVVVAVMMTLIRGLLTPLLICRRLQLSFTGYMTEIYARPAGIGILIAALALALGAAGLKGDSWGELIAIGLLLTPLYYGLVFRLVLAPAHRETIAGWTRGRMARA